MVVCTPYLLFSLLIAGPLICRGENQHSPWLMVGRNGVWGSVPWLCRALWSTHCFCRVQKLDICWGRMAFSPAISVSKLIGPPRLPWWEGSAGLLSNWTTQTQGTSTSKAHVAALVTERPGVMRVPYFLGGFIHALKLFITLPSLILSCIPYTARTGLSSGNMLGLKGFRVDFLLNSNKDILLR